MGRPAPPTGSGASHSRSTPTTPRLGRMESTRAARFTDPYPIDAPARTRAVGEGPFWAPGRKVTWIFRRFDFEQDRAEVRRPMRVIADSPAGAVLWMPGGARTQDTRILGWEDTNPHRVPLAARFRPPGEAPHRITVGGSWQGAGVLKIVPPSVPFSVWVLLKEAAGEAEGGSELRAEWYVNMESTHRRTGTELFTSDHILDLTFPVTEEPLFLWGAADTSDGPATATPVLNPRGAVCKDVDELAASAVYGAWPADWSTTIRDNAMELLDHLGEFSWAFDPEWERLARDLAAPRRPARGGCLGTESI